jgi:predicted PurR-regulated permease PerM
MTSADDVTTNEPTTDEPPGEVSVRSDGDVHRPRFAAARLMLIAASFVIVVAGLRAAKDILIPVLIAVFLAILAARPVAWLRRRRVPGAVAVLLVVVALMLVLSAFGAVVGTSVNEFTNAIPRYQERLEALEDQLQKWLDELPFEHPSVEFIDVLNAGQLIDLLGRGLRGVVAALSNTLLVVLFMVFMLMEAATFHLKLRATFGDRPQLADRVRQVTDQVQRYLAIKTMISLVTGLVIGVWVHLLGLDFALIWGVVAFLLNYIPTIGSIIAAVPAVMLATVQLGVGPALLIAFGYVVVNTVLGNLVEPQLMGRRLGLSTLVVFLSLVFWGWVWGPVGMLLSVPLTMIVKILLENSDDLQWVAVMLDSGRNVSQRLAQADRSMPAETSNVMSDDGG